MGVWPPRLSLTRDRTGVWRVWRGRIRARGRHAQDFVVPGRGRRAHVDLIRGRDGVVTDGGMVGRGVVGVRGAWCTYL